VEAPRLWRRLRSAVPPQRDQHHPRRRDPQGFPERSQRQRSGAPHRPHFLAQPDLLVTDITQRTRQKALTSSRKVDEWKSLDNGVIHRLGIYKADGEITRVVGSSGDEGGRVNQNVHGGQNESLVPPYTRGRFYLALSPNTNACTTSTTR